MKDTRHPLPAQPHRAQGSFSISFARRFSVHMVQPWRTRTININIATPFDPLPLAPAPRFAFLVDVRRPRVEYAPTATLVFHRPLSRPFHRLLDSSPESKRPGPALVAASTPPSSRSP